MAFVFTSENFDEKVLKANGVVAVDFWATWCGPCKMLGPVIEELATEYEGKALIGKLDVDNEKEIAKTYKVMGIPTVLFFKDGELVDRSVGFVPKEDLVKIIEKHL